MQNSEAKTNAILAWLFAPLTSFIWKDSPNEFLRHHARESLYFGIVNIVAWAVIFFLNLFSGVIFGSIPLISIFVSCVWGILWLAMGLFTFVPRLLGIIKASNREKWSMPFISERMSKLIKV